MRTRDLSFSVLGLAMFATGCGDSEAETRDCADAGVCLSAAECSEQSQTPVNPSAETYDCPADLICCVGVEDPESGPDTDGGAETAVAN